MNEIIIKGSKEFVDERGKISNYELSESIEWIGYIESKAGTMRANHYHPIQEQKVLLISGRYISVSKRLPEGEIETIVVNPGDLVITPSNIAHTMVFLEDSILLNLVAGEREKENYGKHTVPYPLVDEFFKEELLKNHKLECHSCGNKNMRLVTSLGQIPLANNLSTSKDEKDESYPLQVNYCEKCHLNQLSHFVPSNKMFDTYLYFSSTTKTFKKHFEVFAKEVVEKYNPKVVIDIGSNDGIFLKPLKELGVEVLGIEPAKNVAEEANKNGLKTISSYMEEIDSALLPQADIITAFNVFAHTKATKEIVEKVFEALKKDGVFIIEVQYLVDTIKDLTFDNIYHEHLFYYSVTSLKNFFSSLDKEVVNVEHVNTHGGSIRVYVKRREEAGDIDSSVQEFLKKEEGFVDDSEVYSDFGKRIKDKKTKALDKFNSLEGEIVGYGAPAKATTVLNYYGIKLPVTIDDNAAKQGLYIPGVKTKIIGKNELDKTPDNIVVLAWNFLEEIKSQNDDLIKKGVNFLTLN